MLFFSSKKHVFFEKKELFFIYIMIVLKRFYAF